MRSLTKIAHDVLHRGEHQTPENRHLDINWQRRLDRAQDEAERILPEGSSELKHIQQHLHACRKLMTTGLESKSE